jgi:hypothetical protein
MQKWLTGSTTEYGQPMLSTTNQYIVVLDACVLAPMPLCDLLLRLAEEPAFLSHGGRPKFYEN